MILALKTFSFHNNKVSVFLPNRSRNTMIHWETSFHIDCCSSVITINKSLKKMLHTTISLVRKQTTELLNGIFTPRQTAFLFGAKN